MINKIYYAVLQIIIACLTLCAGCSSESRLDRDTANILTGHNWQSYVGDGKGVWASVGRQEVWLIENNQLVERYQCSTAKAGAGNKADSGKTPLGWHRIDAKVGGEFEMGVVLKDREWTGEVWESGQDTKDDLILSRILRLEGLEDDINRGGDVDTWNRYIYIHGTNQIDALGQPASAGCIRLDPQEVIGLYERVDEGCCVLITQD